jgi:hypothetical protein
MFMKGSLCIYRLPKRTVFDLNRSQKNETHKPTWQSNKVNKELLKLLHLQDPERQQLATYDHHGVCIVSFINVSQTMTMGANTHYKTYRKCLFSSSVWSCMQGQHIPLTTLELVLTCIPFSTPSPTPSLSFADCALRSRRLFSRYMYMYRIVMAVNLTA